MFVLVVGGGKVGYYLAKELIEANHEVVLLEKDRGRADQIADEIGSMVIAQDGCEGKYLREAGANRADIVAAVTGDDEDNLVICQMAKHHFDVPRTIARVNNPKNERLFKHLGVDEIISPTRMILSAMEQDIPVHELLHLAALGQGDLELIEAQLDEESPAVGRSARDLRLPEGCSVFAVIRAGAALVARRERMPPMGDEVFGGDEPEHRLVGVHQRQLLDLVPRHQRLGLGERKRPDVHGELRPRRHALGHRPAAVDKPHALAAEFCHVGLGFQPAMPGVINHLRVDDRMRLE